MARPRNEKNRKAEAERRRQKAVARLLLDFEQAIMADRVAHGCTNARELGRHWKLDAQQLARLIRDSGFIRALRQAGVRPPEPEPAPQADPWVLLQADLDRAIALARQPSGDGDREAAGRPKRS